MNPKWQHGAFNRANMDTLLTGLGPLGVESPGSGSAIRGHDLAKPVKESGASSYSTVPTSTFNWLVINQDRVSKDPQDRWIIRDKGLLLAYFFRWMSNITGTILLLHVITHTQHAFLSVSWHENSLMTKGSHWSFECIPESTPLWLVATVLDEQIWNDTTYRGN